MKKGIVLFSFLLLVTSVIKNVKLYSVEKLDNNYRIVVGENVNIRSEQNEKSLAIGKIYIATKIQILKKTNTKIKIGDKVGEWVFIDARYYKKGTDETIKGWVFDYYLADLDVFEKMNSFKNCKIEGSIGDYVMSYEFCKDGTYKRKILEYDGMNYEKSTIRLVKGKLYRYRDVIVAMDDDNKHELFYITPKGDLCSQQYDENGQICAKCK